ncbi:peptidase M23 [Paractinoplanes lichenicola]|uniref:Peptidase M23 n=1 Tax=Paractinoplanes lichenicola TaxID=2802976 RepID=A0ABS1VFP6_9ACTN|nr:peptidase M23 [Actinoplanes lichenicola]MBL7253326.1 peptidase M23 [Actinoplanes lichenicola]
MRALFVVAVAVLAGFVLSPMLKADAECASAAAAPAPKGWNKEQVANARLIVTVGHDRRVPGAAQVIAVATAIQESSLRNLKGGDRDSIGLFQQRPSQGWGTPKQLSDPAYQTNKFYDKLLRIDGWQKMRVTEAAQAVQISAFPEAYQKHVPAATSLVGSFSDDQEPCTANS